MELRKASAIAVFSAAAALGFAACSSSPEVEANLTDAKESVQNQANPNDGGSDSDSDSASGSNGSGGQSSGDAGSDSSAQSSGSSDSDSASSNEGDATALEEYNAENSGESSAPEGSSAPEESDGGSSEAAADHSGPQISLVNKRCNSGKLLTQWNIKDASGVQRAVVYRYNEYNAAIDSAAQWMGPETGDGNHWAATSNGSQNLKDNVSIVATDKNGNASEMTITAPASC